ncbi:shikimate kinase [Sinorhizobium terangae]|uniref:shikimate kinase n=1 Tax=Sinorhizobium terangae TaxID=110322 RepID=UPI0017C1BB59|nr:shikimate kinase [Sinorhizobium terangae]MBB4189004.1 shikimate kinase [Sinorhizobium terangae]
MSVRQESSLCSDEDPWLDCQKPGRSQPKAFLLDRQADIHGASSEIQLNDALHDISFARDIDKFSHAVVKYDKKLKGETDHATFLQKAAAQFMRQFLPRWEQEIGAQKSWAYATTCNAVAREDGGETGKEACRRVAARVSRLDLPLVEKIEPKAFSLFVLSFSRYPKVAECRNGMIKIAEFLREQSGTVRGLNGQSLALLVNGFSKWPHEENSHQATAAIAAEIRRRAPRFTGFDSQNLANLVNGFSKWPEDCRSAIVAIAAEVRHRAGGVGRLSDFKSQHLANLVNGFSRDPEGTECNGAVVAIAGEVRRRGDRLSGFASQELSSLVNGFSKWPEDCRGATVAIAREVASQAQRLPNFNPHDLANLVNGFSKLPDAVGCVDAIVAIAVEVLRRADRRALISGFGPQDLAILVNGFSKRPGEKRCFDAIVAIAVEVLRRADRRALIPDFGSQHLANLVNGFSRWPERAECRGATVAIARAVSGPAERLIDFTPQGLANLVNGFSKWPEDCCGAIVAIAGEISRRTELSDFIPQGLANLMNGFSTWPEDCRGAIVAIAREVSRRGDRLSGFDPQALANLVSGFSKWPEDCRDAAVSVASEVSQRGDQLCGFDPQALANLVNGFSKWSDEEKPRHAIVAVAGEVCRQAERTDRLSRFTSQHLANLVNGFGKCPDEADCQSGTIAIAKEIRCRQLSDFVHQGLAMLMNGFGKWSEEAACHQAILNIAHKLGAPGYRLGTFTTPQLSMIANALGRSITRTEAAGEVVETALLKDRLHKLAHYLHYDNDRLTEAGVLSITLIFKGLGKARLVDDLGLLAPAGLARLSELRQAPDFATQVDLETMGNVCDALLPLARSPQKPLRWHRRQALTLLNDLQPVLEQKIEAHLNASDAERTRGPLASRCPALSIYQTLKARAVLERLFRSPYVEGKRADLRVRQQELEGKTKDILHRTRGLIEGDLSNMSWNLIAQIEADNPVDALDLFMEQDAVAIQAQHPASVFDVLQVLRTMDHEPRPPQGDAGLMRLPVVDMQGRHLATEPETRYSIFHRLTSGSLPVVAVQLPATPSAFMLARTLTVDGVPYRMDLFGGSKLKPPRLSVSQVAARAPGEPTKPSGGKLLAIPYAETAPGTAFEQLSRAWAPFKEAYYYTQRRGFAAPPAIKGLSPHDYALEGAFKLMLLPDRRANEEHAFKLRGAQGPIALRPHDGCGFIRASLANLMPAIRRAGEQEDGPDRVLAYGEGRNTSLPVSALQHYPRSEQVADEAREKAMIWLRSKQKPELTSEELFRTVTAANINGPGAVAIPSADGCLHVPTLKSKTLSGGGALIGRSPYDKPNLRPFAAERVKSAVDGDPTAVFLDNCTAIQYSFNVAHKSGEELAADDPTFFAKGILIVVPDEMWPADYADRGLVMSAEDVKCHSSWTEGKDRAKADTPVDCVGILQATEVFAPGSVVAVPPSEQKKLDGDFDGDSVVIIGDRPQLYEHVRQFDQEEQARRLRSLKPPKSHTPAIEGGHYKFGRASQILAATRNVLEIYTGLQRGFLAQSHEARLWFAERAIFGTYEGIHPQLKRDIRGLLEQEGVSAASFLGTFEKARREIEVANHPVAREVAELLLAELEAWAARLDEQALPETAAGVSEAQLATSQPLSALFPELAESYPGMTEPRERVQLLIDRYPVRIDPRPDGYNPHDLVQSANNLLSLGIKVGTDAYKSDTGAHIFMFKSEYLQRLLQQTPGLASVPYVKSMAAALHHGSFDADAALKELKDNPTLAASIMETSIKLAAEQGILSRRSGLRPAAGDSDMTITLSREEAPKRAKIEASRAKQEEESITAGALGVAASLRKAGIQVDMPHLEHRLRSEASMTDQLIGMQVPAEAGVQLIGNAVRHLFELPDKDFTRAFKKAILAFEERDYAEVSTTNWFKTRSPTFVGIKTGLATPGGYRFEVEFHTADSYKAKIDNHDTYKELQKLQEHSGLERAEELMQRARDRCMQVTIPPDALSIPHWGSQGDGTPGAAAAFKLRTVERAGQAEASRSPQAGEIVTALGTRSVVLVGMPSSGKSTIGRVLARRLGLKFVDSDKEIKAKIGKSINDIFAENGEAHFRDLEMKEIAPLLEKGPAVIATGGGAFVEPQTRRLIGAKAVSIWLDTKPEEIRKRLKNDTSRPLLQGPDRKHKLSQMFNDRLPFYQQADIKVVPPYKQDKRNAESCVKALHAYLCGGEAEVARTPRKTGTSDTGGSSSSVTNLLPTTQASRDDAHPAPAPEVAPSFRVIHQPPVRRTDPHISRLSGGPPRLKELGATDWLLDEHVAADYALLREELHWANPDLAVQTRFVEPAVAHLLRVAQSPAEVADVFHDILNGDMANFVFLPVNNADIGEEGTHWSLLLLDRRRREEPVAYHYDSSGDENSALGQQLAARLGARSEPVRMVQQENGYDCGVFVVDATRALVRRLAQGERPRHDPLHLDHLVADRQALYDRLRIHIDLGR